ncbi:MAG TPA: DUF4837 family protein [Bacteroidota bacterium]|nr:DUF4837 family protein [Bacteroidota bacterium]
MIRRLGSLLFLLLILLTNGCEIGKTQAVGEDDEIIVFADSAVWYSSEAIFRDVFEDTVFTPIPERWFKLRWTPMEQFREFEKHKNRLIVGTLDGGGQVSTYVQQALDSTVMALVEEGKEFFFVKYDSRARGQLTMFMASPSISTLQVSMRHRAADLLYYFKRMSLKRELAAIEAERRYHKKEIEESLARRFGWSMTIQHDYWVAIDSSEERFFWIRRANPADMERWIWVHWIDNANPDTLTDRFVIRLRDALTKKFLKTTDDNAYVEIAPYNLEIQTVDFLGRFAYEMRGNWRFSDKSGGGPFINYTFYDAETKRIYMLDGSIFAPRVEKKKLIIQVDGLLHTFNVVPTERTKVADAGR